MFISLATFVVGTNGFSQTIRVEPVITYEYGYPLSIERTPGIINHFGTGGEGSSYNHTFGFGASLQMPDLFTSGIGFSPAIEYRIGLGKFKSQTYPSSEFDAQNFTIETVNHFEVTSTLQTLDLLLPLEFSFGNIGIGVGPWTSIELSRSITGIEYINSPFGARFPQGGTSQKFAGGDTIASSSLHAGIEASLLFRIALSNSLAFEPRLYSRVDLGAISSVSSKAFSTGISFSLVPIPVPEAPKIVKIDTVLTRHDPVTPKLTSQIHFTKNGIRTDAHTPIEVAGYNTYYRQYTEMPPEILFEPDSTSISQRYALYSQNEASHFSFSKLARGGLPEFAKQQLNIIGYRLSKDSLMTIKLRADYGDGVLQATAYNRFVQVNNYFSDVWGSSQRQHTGSVAMITPAHDPANVVEVSGESACAPVPTQWIERSYHIPHLGIEKMIIADAGLSSWDIVVAQNAKTLARFSSADATDETAIADFDLAGDSSVDDEHQVDPAPLVATLTATDFTGQRVVSDDTLLLPSRTQQQKNITEREKFIFVFLSVAAKLGNEAKYSDLMIEKLLTEIRKGAHISVENPPHSDENASKTGSTVAERIVSELKHRPELAADIHIIPRSSEENIPEEYRHAVIVRLDQSKNP
ncbi:MAG TPA: hypothetical protein VEW28_09350 [Candidatus Kapabacteria bacterium]|nr:hypothetical protein [Candidatus Kapabacteria bacterium]